MPIEDFSIRWLTRIDLARVIEIEQACFSAPWSEETFLEQIKKKSIITLVCQNKKKKICGYVFFDMRKKGIEIVNIAVDPEFRRLKLGTFMMNRLISKLDENRTDLTCYVSENNLAAQLFLRKNNFKALEIVKEHFGIEGEYIDAYFFKYIGAIHDSSEQS